MCQVLKDLTYQQEAQLFNDLNGIRKSVKLYDVYNADIEAGDEATIDIKKCVEFNGMTITRKISENKISGISQLRAIYKKDGYDHLSKTLNYIKDTWGGIESSLVPRVLSGVSKFLDIHSDNVKYELFVKQLGLIEPYRLIKEADNDTSNLSFDNKFSNIIIKYYNRRIHHNRL
jgi:hypothetical protein